MVDSQFCALVDGVLTIVGVPFKHGVYDPGESRGEIFIGYNFYEVPKLHGDGDEEETEFTITLDIISVNAGTIDSTYERLLPLMLENGFTRAGGSYSVSSAYPKYYQKSVDFKYC